MSLTAAQVQFAAEFLTLAVTAGALALAVIRPATRRPGPVAPAWLPTPPAPAVALATVTLLVLGAAAFAHGSLLVSGHDVIWVGLGRLVAAIALAMGLLHPALRPLVRSRTAAGLLALGSALWAAAGAVELLADPNRTTGGNVVAGFLLAGSVVSSAALVTAAQRSIAVRVAASGAATLVIVVVVLALALSSVISSAVDRQELSRLAARAHVEQASLTDVTALAGAAGFAQADLALFFQQTPDPLQEYAAGTPEQMVAAATAIAQRLQELSLSDPSGTLAYSNPDGTELLLPGVAQPITAPGFAGDPALLPACGSGRQGLYQIGTQVVMVASSPECTPDHILLGVVLSTLPLDDRYLAGRRRIDPTIGLALVFGRQVIATAGTTPVTALRLARQFATEKGQIVAHPSGNGFASVSTIGVNGSPQDLSLVLTSFTTPILDTRLQLFRTLFLIAFGGTVIALGLAVFTGDRITAGLRRLTVAAAAIQAGDYNVRAGVTGEDEVAALGGAFDAMLDSVAEQSAALQTAAEDETRLRNRLEAVVAGMNDALVAVDTEGRVTDFNRAAEQLSGVAAERAVGMPAEQVMIVRTEEGLPAGRQLFRADSRSAATVAKIARGGIDIPVAVSSGSLHGPAGEVVGRVLVFRDMRREHEVEQMKTEFLSRVGHELRTPLTGILGYADILLRRQVPPERAQAWYEEILGSARRLLRIVEMLEFFALEGAGRVVLRPEPFDAGALVNGIASSWAPRLPANLTLGKRISRQELLVSADRRWLSLALDELLDNAVKFSPEGGRIVVRVTGDEENVEISVSDRGMGMTEEQHEVIFGEFVQGDASDTRRFGGLGLGLAVARRVVEGHGGQINCRSTPGRGSTFTISLPAWPGPESVDGSKPAARPPAKKRAAPTRRRVSPKAGGSAT